jgi:hypothetical protein
MERRPTPQMKSAIDRFCHGPSQLCKRACCDQRRSAALYSCCMSEDGKPRKRRQVTDRPPTHSLATEATRGTHTTHPSMDSCTTSGAT